MRLSLLLRRQRGRDRDPLLEALARFRGHSSTRGWGCSLAVAIVLSSSVLPNVDTVADISALLARDVRTVVHGAPQLDFHEDAADDAWLRTYRAFHLRDGYYVDDVGSPSGFASAWHQFQVLNMLDIASTAHEGSGPDPATILTHAVDALDAYWDAAPAGYPAGYDPTRPFGFGAPDRYVDDNLWMAQLLMHQYQRTGDEAYVARVKQIVDLFLSERDAPDGAAYWKVQFANETNRDECLVSNATAIPSLVDVYLAGYGDASDVATAEDVFAWVQRLRDPTTGLYFDKIMGNGEVDTTIYTYGQAEVLESMVQLGRVDEAHFPLDDAVSFARLSMTYFADRGGYGISKFDVIYLRSLMHLASLVEDDALTQEVRAAIALAKAAIPRSPTALPDAASAAAIVSLSALPFDAWSDLAYSG